MLGVPETAGGLVPWQWIVVYSKWRTVLEKCTATGKDWVLLQGTRWQRKGGDDNVELDMVLWKASRWKRRTIFQEVEAEKSVQEGQ